MLVGIARLYCIDALSAVAYVSSPAERPVLVRFITSYWLLAGCFQLCSPSTQPEKAEHAGGGFVCEHIVPLCCMVYEWV